MKNRFRVKAITILASIFMLMCVINIIPAHTYADSVETGLRQGIKTEYSQSLTATDISNIKNISDQIIREMSLEKENDNGNIIVPDRESFKDKLLKHYYEEPDKQAANIKNIDSIVDSYMNYFSNMKSNDYVAQDFRLYPHTHYWHIYPTLTNHVHWIAYDTSLIGIDCYRANVAGQKNSSESRTVNYTLGLSGSVEIKGTLSIGGSWSYGESVTTTITTGTTCPAWTICWWRPYARYSENYYTGTYDTEFYDLHGNLHIVSEGKYLSEKISLDETTEFQSRENTAHNPSASSPAPYTGCPNAWW